MAWWNWGNSDDGEMAGYGDLTEQELGLLNEADAAQADEPLDTGTFLHAFPDEGAVYIHENQGDDYNVTFSYGDGGQGDYDLLTTLNSNWEG